MPLTPRIIKKIERPSTDALGALAHAGVATAHEAYARTGLMFDIAPVTRGATVAGSAITCLNYAGDNLMLHAALDMAEPGDVIVVAVTSPSSHGMFGELLATSCRAHGVVGIVLDAGARDTAQLNELAFPTWSRCISSAGTVKDTPGWVNVPVSCGGQIVFPGDAIVADDDGVVVISRNDVDAVAAKATERLRNEDASRARLAAGSKTLDKGSRRELLAPFILDSEPER